MAKFRATELIRPYVAAQTFRLGAGSGTVNNVGDTEIGKFVKLVGDSRFDLCAVGDPIEGFVESINDATQDGFTIAGIRRHHNLERKHVVLDGLEATPGTGAIAVGDYVVCGTVTAKGTRLADGAFGTRNPRVVRATDQAAAAASPFAWRVISADGTAVGSFAVIEAVG